MRVVASVMQPSEAGKNDHMRSVAVVIGSTRPKRICPVIADWIKRVAEERSALRYELVDLALIGLPFLDEPLKAALGDRLEIVVTAADVDEDWQLRDPGVTLEPYREQARRLDAQLVEALEDTQ
jgi:NAD(P)H-dependent FMN reductase